MRLRGLDSLRFVLATWVVLGHFGPHLARGPSLARLAVNNAFVGPCAVIAFFTLSGLCIRYPQRHVDRVDLLAFYSRREVRILPPLLATIALGRVVHVPMPVFGDSILWSLVCEEVYYLLYPAMHAAFRRGWLRPMLGASFVATYVLVAIVPNASGNYPAYGYELNWLLGLPCWLLGALVAEVVDEDAAPLSPWPWRLAVLGASVACSVLRFHSPLTFPWTLNLFAILCAAWILAEARWYRTHTPWPWLERLGLASYSVYLTHVHGRAIGDALGLGAAGGYACIAALAAGCYWLVESPAHRLARRIGRRATARSTSLTPSSLEAQ